MSEGHASSAPLTLFALTLFLFVGSLAKQLTPKFYTVGLLLIGVATGVIIRFTALKETELGGAVLGLSEIDPHLMLYIFLPPLIFESAFSIEWHLFKKTAWQCLLLAGPGIILASFLTAAVLKGFFYPGWPFSTAVLLGTVLSATDPVAVVSLLKELGAKKSLATLIEGESLMNDGTAMVIFNVVYPSLKLATYNPVTRVGVHAVGIAGGLSIAGTFVKMALGGALWGLVCGFLTSAWHNATFNNAMVEITISFGAAYFTFFVAEFYFEMSGVLALVAHGIYSGYMGRTSISPEVAEFLHEFWEEMAFFSNTLIFLLTGLIIGSKRIVLGGGTIELIDYAWLALLYMGLHIARTAVFLLLRPFMDRLGYGVSFQDCAISVWGGLRGAVGLALALVVYGNRCGFRTKDAQYFSGNYVHFFEECSKAGPDGKGNCDCIDPEIADRVLFHTAGIVMLTLCVNSLTIQSLVERLGMDKVPISKEHIFGIAMQKFRSVAKDEIRVLKQDPLYGCASWPDVRRYQFKPPKIKVAFYSTQDSENQIEREEMQEARRRFLVTVKASYWRQFKEGLLGRQAARELIELTDQALDHGCDMENDWEIINNRAMHVFSSPIISLKRVLSWPVMNTLARRILFHSLSHSYDTISSYLAAREEAIKLLSRFLSSEELFQDIKDRAMSDISRAKTCLFHIQKEFPEISASIATNHAARTVLNTQRHAVHELREEGMLDEAEASRMTRAIEAQMKRLLSAPPAVELPDKERLLAEMLWLETLPANIIRRVHDATHETLFQEGEIVMKQGDIGNEMYLIARGTVAIEINEAVSANHPGDSAAGSGGGMGRRKSIWNGSGKFAKVGDTIRSIRRRTSLFTRSAVTNLSRQGEANGVFPVEGGHHHPDGGDHEDPAPARVVKVDDLGVGSVIGELACLTRKHRFATVRITSPAILFCIKSEQLLQIVEDSPELEKSLWTTAGKRLAENLLATTQPYSSWSRRSLRKWVQKWELKEAEHMPSGVLFRNIFILLSGTAIPLRPDTDDTDNHDQSAMAAGLPLLAPCIVRSHTDRSRYKMFFPHDAQILVPPWGTK